MDEVERHRVEKLCRSYSRTPADELLDAVTAELRSLQDLSVHDPSAAGRLTVLSGCLHYDLGDRTAAEAARVRALRLAREAGDAETEGWAHELAAWFALAEGRHAEALEHARRGRALLAGRGVEVSDAGVQLALQEAKACARLGDRAGAEAALADAAALLARLPGGRHLDDHFVFDPSKLDFFAASCHLQLGDDARAEELLLAGIARHRRPDGSTDAPMRTAGAQLDLAVIHARRGELDAALAGADAAYAHVRRSLGELRRRSEDLLAVLLERFPGEPRVREFAVRLQRLGT